MQDLIQALDEYLKSKRPKLYAELQPGLSETEITRLELRLGYELHPEAKSLYAWKNGQALNSEEPLQFNFYWLPLDAAVERNIQLGEEHSAEQIEKDWWNPKWLPLLDNTHGDHLCLDHCGVADGEAGQLVNFWGDWEDRSIEYPNLASFLGIFLSSMQQEMWTYSEEDGYQPKDEHDWEDFVEESIPGYPLDHEATP